jgi:hypothetical protein
MQENLDENLLYKLNLYKQKIDYYKKKIDEYNQYGASVSNQTDMKINMTTNSDLIDNENNLSSK